MTTRTPLTVHPIAPNGSTPLAPGDTADPTNGHSITPPTTTERVVVLVHNTDTADHRLTVRGNAAGDLPVTVRATEATWLGPLNSARFGQDDGTVHVDLDPGFVGTLIAYAVPATT